VWYPSVEHAYQASKTTDPEVRAQIQVAPTAGNAKGIGSRLEKRGDFDDIREGVMLHLLRQKFADESLGWRLIATGKRPIVELNTWGDIFWGVSGGIGENRLGKLLEQVRNELALAARDQVVAELRAELLPVVRAELRAELHEDVLWELQFETGN
jgi:predicted NAD-dependent protein-ADP-ribosyltransferase YbiA (DUF1768 family)